MCNVVKATSLIKNQCHLIRNKPSFKYRVFYLISYESYYKAIDSSDTNRHRYSFGTITCSPSAFLDSIYKFRLGQKLFTANKMTSVPDTDAQGENVELDYDKETSKGEIAVKVICLGDSAVGKSK